ncbi:hypothetical protein GO286_04219 [Ralstonia solanacearum]|nr:hypothetical protein [Ralstonia solanacearum]
MTPTIRMPAVGPRWRLLPTGPRTRRRGLLRRSLAVGMVGTLLGMGAAHAEPLAGRVVTLGQTRIVLPEAEGLRDVTDEPRGAAMGAAVIEPQAQLLAFQVRPEDSRTGFLLVKTARDMATQDISAAQFAGYTDYMRSVAQHQRHYDDVADTANQQFAAQRPAVEAAAGHRLGATSFAPSLLIANEHDDDQDYGTTVATRVDTVIDGRADHWTDLMCSHLLRVRARVLIVQWHARLTQAGDIDRLRAACRAYVSALQAANPSQEAAPAPASQTTTPAP